MAMEKDEMKISKDNMQKIYAQVKKAYPYECCGVLAGNANRVEEVKPVENINKDRMHDRYEISTDELYKIDKYVRSKGWSIIGFYHSHPDHPAYPSAFDHERAVEGYVYIIVAVSSDGKLEAKAWILDDKEHRFVEEEIDMGYCKVKNEN
jgi:proteasome lid subunit RPN8/RPN11